jgi:glutaredoxin
MAHMENVELFGAARCPFTGELRDHLQWNGVAFVEYDVDTDASARARLTTLVGGTPAVPVLVENGRVTQVGWRGRSCVVGP